MDIAFWLGMFIGAVITGFLIGVLESRKPKQEKKIKKQMRKMKTALEEMAALRERFDNQYANLTLEMDKLRREIAALRQSAGGENKRETAPLEETQQQ